MKGSLRLISIALVVGMLLTFWWTSSYPNNPMDASLYGLFGFVGFVVGSVAEALIRRMTSKQEGS